MAVVNLSCAPAQGTAVTLTVVPGLAVSNCFARAGSFSPSAPIAQTVTVPLAGPAPTDAAEVPEPALPLVPRPHAVAVSAAAAQQAMVTAMVRLIDVSPSRSGLLMRSGLVSSSRTSRGRPARWAAAGARAGGRRRSAARAAVR